RFARGTLGQGKEGSNTASIVIGARGTDHGIVVRPDQDEFGTRPVDFSFDIVKRATPHLVTVSLCVQAGVGKGTVDIICRGTKGGIVQFVAFTNLTGKLLDVAL